jgi:hypothetical protein
MGSVQSFSVHLLPYVEQQGIWSAIQIGGSPPTTANIGAYQASLDLTTADFLRVQNFAANVRVFTDAGASTLYNGTVNLVGTCSATLMKSFPDGTSNTIMLATRYGNSASIVSGGTSVNCSPYDGQLPAAASSSGGSLWSSYLPVYDAFYVYTYVGGNFYAAYIYGPATGISGANGSSFYSGSYPTGSISANGNGSYTESMGQVGYNSVQNGVTYNSFYGYMYVNATSVATVGSASSSSGAAIGSFFGSVPMTGAPTPLGTYYGWQLAPTLSQVNCTLGVMAHSFDITGLQLAMCDGSVHTVPGSVSANSWNLAMQPNDGQAMGSDWLDTQ